MYILKNNYSRERTVRKIILKRKNPIELQKANVEVDKRGI